MTDKTFDIAVVGATGLVGETLFRVLEERNFPVGNIYPLASNRSVGKSITFRGSSHPILELTDFDFSRVQIGLFSAGAVISKEFGPKAAAAGCIVIDNTSEFRYEDDIPLMVPEVNPHVLEQYRNRGIIANPNCSTIQLVVALKPIYDAVGIERIQVATYQSVSGAGRKGIEELAEQSIALMSGKTPPPAKVVPKRIAFNAVPQIDRFEDNGYTPGRDEDCLGDAQNPGGSDPQGERHGGAGAGVLRPFRGCQPRDPDENHGCGRPGPAEKGAWRRGSGRAPPRGVPNGGYRGSEPRHSLCRENT